MRFIRALLLTIVWVCVLIITSCAQIKPVPENTLKPRICSNADFEIVLGTNWKRRDNEESFEWEDEKNMEEIIISVLSAKEPMDSQMRLTTAKRLMEIRQQVINETAEGKVSLTQVETVEKDETTELIIRGIDQGAGMQIYTAVIVRPTRTVTFAYYKYPSSMTEAGFRAKSKQMRSTLKVH